MNLIGNSAYGSLIMDKTKHEEVKYVEGVDAACLQVNESRFRSLTELSEAYFEIGMAKKHITLDLPIQLGYFVLQHAKLRMLEL